MKRLLFIVFISLCCLTMVQAQTLSKTSVTEIKLRNTGAIIQNGQVKGYYYFYNLEKEDRKNNNYLLTVTDENLREINSVTITRPNTYLLIESAFNGEAFGFLFYDSRERSIELIGYDRTLKETGKVTKELGNKYANAGYAYIAQGHEPQQAFLVAVPGKGFTYYGIKDDSKCEYEIELYDNNMKRAWATYANMKDDYDFENSAEALQDEQYIGSMIMKRTGIMSTNIETDLLMQSVADGKEVFRIPMATSKYKMALAEITFNKEKQQFTIFGEYYTKDQNIIKDESQGFITVILDLKGKIVTEKTNSWTDVNKAIEAKDKDSFDKTNVMFHEFIQTADGQTFAIGEQYKKVGIPTAPKINVYNLVIFQFDANFAIKKINVFEKDKNALVLPGAMIVMGSKYLSYVAKALGGFDYRFSQIAPDKNTFIVSYVNYDREKGEKAKNVLGSVVYTPEKVFTVDKLPLTRKSSSQYVYRAKQGYVMVTEYFPKEKRIDSRLEKVNY